MTSESGLIVETLAPGIRQVRLARPERLNALGVDMVRALRTAVEAESTARTLKRVVHAGVATTLEAGLVLERAALAEVFSAPDYAEGLAAFAAKRPPVFTD